MFVKVQISHIPQGENAKADKLAKLACIQGVIIIKSQSSKPYIHLACLN